MSENYLLKVDMLRAELDRFRAVSRSSGSDTTLLELALSGLRRTLVSVESFVNRPQPDSVSNAPEKRWGWLLLKSTVEASRLEIEQCERRYGLNGHSADTKE